MESTLKATYKIDAVSRAPIQAGYVSLLFTWGEETRAVALREGQSLVVGRAEPSALVIDDRSLSRTHARLTLRDGRVNLEDLDSTNGCLLNGTSIACAAFGEEDVARLGTVELRVCAHARLQNQVDSVSHAAFMRALSEELTRARLFGRAVSVVVIKHEATKNPRAMLQAALKPVDRVCGFADTVTFLLLPEQDGVTARLSLERTCCIAKDVRGALASYPAITCTAEELVSRALDACHAALPGQLKDAQSASASDMQAPVLQSPCMLRLYDLVSRAARTTLPVLVHGETGAGKELVARAIHDKSPRARGPFKALNCATIPSNLLESVLFGHERGAFTGADKQAQGVFEQAQGGTVFLDEVGELSAQAQAALLRVLELRKIVRLGATKEIDVDCRVVAATHRDLTAMVRAGTFREDLMFRLDALTLRVPPLRERREEILPLAELFLARARAQWGASAQGLSEDASEALVAYAWPGNVRQLKNVMERAVVVCSGEAVDLEDLPGEISSQSGGVSPPNDEPFEANGAAGRADGFRSLPARVRDFEMAIIRDALEKAHGNQAQAARMLGVPRRTLASKVHALNLLGY